MKKRNKFCECDFSQEVRPPKPRKLKPPFEHLGLCYLCKLLTKPEWVVKK